jgi:hypothetical protein
MNIEAHVLKKQRARPDPSAASKVTTNQGQHACSREAEDGTTTHSSLTYPKGMAIRARLTMARGSGQSRAMDHESGVMRECVLPALAKKIMHAAPTQWRSHNGLNHELLATTGPTAPPPPESCNVEARANNSVKMSEIRSPTTRAPRTMGANPIPVARTAWFLG